jgi:protein-disulfide isomerase
MALSWEALKSRKKYWIALSLVAVAVAIAVYDRTATDNAPANDPVVLRDQSSAGGASPPAAATQARNQPNAGFPFKDTTALKPPAGARVAIYEFEDLECPACAYAYPIVHAAAAHYKIPVLRHDYPWSFHIWSFDAAVTARYLQDKISPQLADDFRRDVFAAQTRIASKDDLAAFTRAWFQSHGQTLPFVIDPSGACKLEVESDRALGDRVGVHSTPCIFVVTQTKWVAVPDVSRLSTTIDAALAETS